jgi:tyrosine-protein kinase Etk/Wzc
MTMPQDTVVSHSETSLDNRSNADLIQDVQENQIDLIELAILLLQGKKTIFRFMLAAVVITAVVVFGVMKPMYTAEATILPPQTAPGSGMAQLASQLGSLGALGALSGVKSSSEVYLGILGSRTIADSLIKQYDLREVYGTKRLSDTAKKLKSRSSFETGKNTLITISVEDHDPKRAADLANSYLDALREQNGRLALTEAGQRRLFFEQQLEREKNALADAEVELKKTQEQTGLIAPGGQAQVEIETIAQTRAQIASFQIEMASLKQGATDENPAVVRLQTQISDLQQQLRRLENDPANRQTGNIQPPTSKMPGLALEYVRKQREVKYNEVLFEMIAKQYEAARLDESRESPVLQVVDRALVPDKKSGPPRLLLMVSSCFLGAFVGAVYVIWTSFISRLEDETASASKLATLRKAASLWH